MPLKYRELTGSFQLSISTERQKEEGGEYQNGIEASFSNGKAGIKANLGDKVTTKTTDKFSFTSCQVTTKGLDNTPTWVFELRTGEPVFKGLLKPEKVGTINVNDHRQPCCLEATFVVSLRDIQFIDGRGIWFKNLFGQDLIREEKVVLDRRLAKVLLKKQFQPYLSKVVCQYV